MNILERAQANWDSRAQHEIEVPEWGESGKPLTVYFKTPNLATVAKVEKESKGNAIEQMARMVIYCATDANGKRLFSSADFTQLMNHSDPAVVARIATRMAEETNVNIEDAEKNSAATPQG